MGRKLIWTEERIITEIKKAMQELDIDHLPSDRDIIMTRGYTVSKWMRKNGTTGYWSEKLGVPTKREYLRLVKQGKIKPREPRATKKADKFSIYLDEAEKKYREERERAYNEQCKPSEVKPYKLSPKELAKYQKLEVKEKRGTSSIAMLHALSRGWGNSKKPNFTSLEA